MKKYLLIVVLLSGINVFAGAHIFEVTPLKGKEFTINFKTKQTWPNRICNLKVTRLDIISPVPKEDSGATYGRIQMTTELDRWKPCMTGSGPNIGTMDFRVGWSLPELHYGSYEVLINGILEGKLHLAFGNAQFESQK